MSVRIELDVELYEGYLLDGNFGALYQLMNTIYQQKLCFLTAQQLEFNDPIRLDDLDFGENQPGSLQNFLEFIQQNNPIQKSMEQLKNINSQLEHQVSLENQVLDQTKEKMEDLSKTREAIRIENGQLEAKRLSLQDEVEKNLKDLIDNKLRQLCEDYAEKLIVSQRTDIKSSQLQHLTQLQTQINQTVQSLPRKTEELLNQVDEVNQCPQLQQLKTKYQCFNLKDLFDHELRENTKLKLKIQDLETLECEQKSQIDNLSDEHRGLAKCIQETNMKRLSVEDQINKKIPKLIKLRHELQQLQTLQAQSKEQKQEFQNNDDQLRFQLKNLTSTLKSAHKDSYLSHLKFIIPIGLLLTYMNFLI